MTDAKAPADAAVSRDSGKNAVELFAGSFLDSISQPLRGVEQIVNGSPQKTIGTTDHPSGFDHAVEAAGSLLGNATLFIGTAYAASKIPGMGKYAPTLAGAAIGFLSPTSAGEGITQRLGNAAIGAGTVFLLQKDPGLFGSKIGNLLGVNGAVGALNTQAETYLHTGHFASASDTLTGAATWSATGLAFHALGAPFRSKGNLQPEVPPVREPLYRTTPAPPGRLLAGDFAVNLSSEGQARAYDMHVPAGYDGSKPLPVMMILDGMNKETVGVRSAESQMNHIADRENFAVVYPYAQSNRSVPLGGKVYAWNSEGTGLTNKIPGYDDANFIHDVLKDVRGRVGVDTSRIYGVGFSEGGMLLNRIQATRPGTFAGLGLVHSTMNGAEPIPLGLDGKPVPVDVMVVHSARDFMLPFKGGRGLMTALLPNAGESKPYAQAPFWAKVNDSAEPVTTTKQDIQQTDYVSRDGEHRVREYILQKGQHAWDGSPLPGWALIGRPLKPEVFSTSERLWEFLKTSKLSRTLEDPNPVPFLKANR